MGISSMAEGFLATMPKVILARAGRISKKGFHKSNLLATTESL